MNEGEGRQSRCHAFSFTVVTKYTHTHAHTHTHINTHTLSLFSSAKRKSTSMHKLIHIDALRGYQPFLLLQPGPDNQNIAGRCNGWVHSL